MHLEVLAPLGVRVTGLSLSDVTPGTVLVLRRMLAEHGVLDFPRQDDVDDDVCARVMRSLGGLAPVHGEARTDGCRSYQSQSRHRGRPPAYTALRAVGRPGAGARALFIDQLRAFETLPVDVRDWLIGRTVRRVDTDRSTGAETVWERPVFACHPLSGRIALHLSLPARGTGISGLPADVAEETMDHLVEHSRAHATTLEHVWSAGDVVMWDNDRVLHATQHHAA